MGRIPNSWAIRKPARALLPGDRFVFGADIGGDLETLTVVAVETGYGITEIETEELDFTIEVLSNHVMVMK